jgi:hypothetical protein
MKINIYIQFKREKSYKSYEIFQQYNSKLRHNKTTQWSNKICKICYKISCKLYVNFEIGSSKLWKGAYKVRLASILNLVSRCFDSYTSSVIYK